MRIGSIFAFQCPLRRAAKFGVIAAAAVLVGRGETAAQAPYTMSYQGSLTKPNGDPVDSTLTMLFRLYKGGVMVWSESHPGVQVTDGHFEVNLGLTTPFDTVSFNTPAEVGLKVGSDAEISPRSKIGASPIALTLQNVRVRRVQGSLGSTVNIVGGYDGNFTTSGVQGATISGGGYATRLNSVQGNLGTVGGGQGNTASGNTASVGGGALNMSIGDYSTIPGGGTNLAAGDYATVAGGRLNRAGGDYALAAGYYARANHAGSFVWSDRSLTGAADSLATLAPNQFLIRAAGGVGIGTRSPDARLHVATSAIGVTADDVNRDDIVIEDGDAILGIYSNAGGTWGSGIVLAELDGSGFLEDKWSIARRTSPNAGALVIAYGSDDDYANNTPLVTIAHGSPGLVQFTVDGTVQGDGVVTPLLLAGSGEFQDDLNVLGTLTKSAGSFRIDHPLDPDNKYLSHSFVESPDMMNLYNGNVVLDAAGEATIEMPEYFEALNRDFRYQLTAIGSPSPGLYVADEISAGKFRIAGGSPWAKVSWLVTGIRHDRYAREHRIKVETEKPISERGESSR